MVNADELARTRRGDPGVPDKDQDAPTRWEEPTAQGQEPLDATAQPYWWRELPERARGWIVDTVQEPMREYCGQGHKVIYCDKSLDSVHHLELVRALFPGFRAVLLFRHVMDTVASGLEASPWGFQAYGYAPYVQASPGNAVAALASYWLDHVGRALSWEKERPELSHRVRYEDLVTAPEDTITGIQRFLKVDEDLSVLASAFDREPARGPGDYKVSHTTAVHTKSLGHGKRVPVTMLPPPLLRALNEKLEALGYEPLDRGWNTAERTVDGGSLGFWARRLKGLMSDLRVDGNRPDLGVFAVLAEDHRALRWVIDPSIGDIQQGDGEVEGVLTGTAEDLVLMLTEEENLGVLLRSGRVRHVVADEEHVTQDLEGQLHGVVKFLRRGLTTADGTASSAD